MFGHERGPDLPVWKQFLAYAWRLLHGDFGTSLATQQKVLTEFLTLFPATLELASFALLIALSIGLPAGAISAGTSGGAFPTGRGSGAPNRRFRTRFLLGLRGRIVPPLVPP